ncbi:Myeloblastin [Bulinus truncatus]|nr:Myeloblastin [Bulinus truncatus]
MKVIIAAPVHPFPKRNFWGRRNNHDSGIATPFKKRDHADHPPIRPSQVSVQFFDQSNGWGSVCGGAIIGNYQVLTSARCLKFLDNRPARVVAGAYDLASPLPTTQFPEVAKVIPYNNDNGTFKNDIALLVLKKPFVFNENAQGYTIYSCGVYDIEYDKTRCYEQVDASAKYPGCCEPKVICKGDPGFDKSKLEPQTKKPNPTTKPTPKTTRKPTTKKTPKTTRKSAQKPKKN